MMKILTASLLSLAIVSPALAKDDDYAGPLNVPRGEWLTVSDVTAKLEAKGFKVREIEADDGAYEFEATDASGARIEGHVHPATGEVLSTRPDND